MNGIFQIKAIMSLFLQVDFFLENGELVGSNSRIYQPA